jgi:hypothetical protein
MRRGSPLVLGLAVAVALVGGGCEYLLGYPMDPEDWEQFTEPSPLARYPTGTATVVIDGGAPLVMDRVTTPGRLDEGYGAEVVLSNEDGWFVRISGATTDSSFLGFASGWVTLDRITDGHHWTTMDPSRCIVTVSQADERGLEGTASCKGLRWVDAVGGSQLGFEPAYVEGQAPFDAEITFEARPGLPRS